MECVVMKEKNKIEIIEEIAVNIKYNKLDKAQGIILNDYPFKSFETYHRSYTVKQKMLQFVKDGFVDRYSGDKLLNPGILKVISLLFPNEFPYHPHWKMSESHIAYWELTPTIDHIHPIAQGGEDNPDNWATTSMMHNLIKNNWTLEQLQWKLYPVGNITEWDGLTNLFIEIVDGSPNLLKDNYILTWYNVSK